MSSEAAYNPSDPTVPNVVTAWHEVDVPTGNPNTINNPDTSQVSGNVIPYACKVSGNSVVPFSGADQTAWDAAVTAATLAAQRSGAVLTIQTAAAEGKIQRAVVHITVNEFNTLIAWIAQMHVNIQAASSLADLKTRDSSNTVPNTITLAQVKTAIINDINAGNVD